MGKLSKLPFTEARIVKPKLQSGGAPMLTLHQMGLNYGERHLVGRKPHPPLADEKHKYDHIEPEHITQRLARMEGPGIEPGTELPWTINGKP